MLPDHVTGLGGFGALIEAGGQVVKRGFVARRGLEVFQDSGPVAVAALLASLNLPSSSSISMEKPMMPVMSPNL